MMTDNKKKKWPQYLISFLGNISILSFGLQAGWLSPLQPAFESDDSPLLPTPLTTDEISWIGSLPSVSLVISVPIFGFIYEKLGRKTTCLIATAPNILTYLLIIFADNVYLIYVARLIGGFCSAGGFIVTPIYINEISENHLRGFLGGTTGSYIKIGIIISYILGAYTSYLTLNLISLSFTLIFLAFYLWMPESPVYLVSIGKKEEARNCLKKLRGNNHKIIEKEMNEIENIINETRDINGKLTLIKFFTSRATLRASFIVCGIYTVQMLSGYPAIIRYSVDVLQDTGESAFSPFIASILIAVAQLLSALIGVLILDKTGRKFLLLICTFIMGLSLLILASYLFLKDSYGISDYVKILKFLPTISLIFFIGGYAAGYGCVPFVIVPEIFAPEARGIAATVSNIWVSFLEFVVVKMFLIIKDHIGLASSLSILVGTCGAGCLFLQFCMFETKGLTLSMILKKLNGYKEAEDYETGVLKPFIKTQDSEKRLEEAKAGTLL